MKKYHAPEIQAVSLTSYDVITTSVENDGLKHGVGTVFIWNPGDESEL